MVANAIYDVFVDTGDDTPNADGKYGGWSSWHVMDAFRAARMRTRQADADYLAKLELAAHVADRAVSLTPDHITKGHSFLPPDGTWTGEGCGLCGWPESAHRPPNPVDQFNARRIAARAINRVTVDDVAGEIIQEWADNRKNYKLHFAMSVPLPHDTDRHSRLMPYRARP